MRKANASDSVDNDIDEQAKLLWLRREIQVGIDEIERGEGIEFASIDEFVAEIDRIWEEVEQEGA